LKRSSKNSSIDEPNYIIPAQKKSIEPRKIMLMSDKTRGK
jgi:hypothetical protein